MTGKLEINDHINKLAVTVTYNPPANGQDSQSGGMLKSLKNKFFKPKSDQVQDWMSIVIEQKA